MGSVFIILNWIVVLINKITMIPCRRVSYRELSNSKITLITKYPICFGLKTKKGINLLKKRWILLKAKAPEKPKQPSFKILHLLKEI